MSFPNLLNPTNDPQVAEQLSQTLSGIPEAALTVASAVPAAAKGGIDALMLAGMEPERRPMGIMVNGRWEPSVVGNVPMPLTAAVEQGMQDVMFTPRSQAGQEAVQGLGSFVDTLMEPATRATDAAIMAGIQRDLPSPAIALPLTFLTAACPLAGLSRQHAPQPERLTISRCQTLSGRRLRPSCRWKICSR